MLCDFLLYKNNGNQWKKCKNTADKNSSVRITEQNRLILLSNALFVVRKSQSSLTLICIKWVPGDPRTIF